MTNKNISDADIPTLTEVLVKGKKSGRKKAIVPDLFADPNLLDMPAKPSTPETEKKSATKKTVASNKNADETRAVTLSKKDLQECIDQVLEQHIKDLRKDLMQQLQTLLKPSNDKK